MTWKLAERIAWAVATATLVISVVFFVGGRHSRLVTLLIIVNLSAALLAQLAHRLAEQRDDH